MATQPSPSKDKSVPAAKLTFVLLEGPHVSRLARGATLHVPKNAIEISVYPYWSSAELYGALRRGLAPTLPRSAEFDILIADGTGKKLVEPPHDKKSGIGGFAVLSAVFADKKSTLNKFFYVRPAVKVDLLEESESSNESSSDEEVQLVKKPRPSKPSGGNQEKPKTDSGKAQSGRVRSATEPGKAVSSAMAATSLAQRRERRRSSDSSSSGRNRSLSQGASTLKRSKSSDSESSSPVKKTKIDLRGATKMIAVSTAAPVKTGESDGKSEKQSPPSKVAPAQKQQSQAQQTAKKSAEKKKAAVNVLRGGAKLKIKMPFKPTRSPPSSPVKTPKVKTKDTTASKTAEKVEQSKSKVDEKREDQTKSKAEVRNESKDYEVTTERTLPSGPIIKRVFVPPIAELLKPAARINAASSPVTCLDCGERAPNWNALSAHKRTCAAANNKVTRFACSQCEYKTTVKGKIDEHMFMAHGAIRKDMLQPAPTPTGNVPPASTVSPAAPSAIMTAAEAISSGSFVINICGACNKVFSSSQELQKHNTIFHPASEISQISVGRDGIKLDDTHDYKSITGNPFLRSIYGQALSGGGGTPVLSVNTAAMSKSPPSPVSPMQGTVQNRGQTNLATPPTLTSGTSKKEGTNESAQSKNSVANSTATASATEAPSSPSKTRQQSTKKKTADKTGSAPSPGATEQQTNEKAGKLSSGVPEEKEQVKASPGTSKPVTVKRVMMPIQQAPSQRAQTMINRAMEMASKKALESAFSPKNVGTIQGTNYRPFRCAQRGCVCAFIHLKDKLQHEGRVHGRCHVCEGCKQTFQSSFILEKHQQLCPAVCRYCCQDCGMPFKSPSILNYHFAKFHKNPDETPPVGCADCGMSFKAYHNFVLHRQNLHADENIFLRNVIPHLNTKVLKPNEKNIPEKLAEANVALTEATKAKPVEVAPAQSPADDKIEPSSDKTEASDKKEESSSDEEEASSSDEEATPRKLRSISVKESPGRRSSRLVNSGKKGEKSRRRSPRRSSLPARTNSKEPVRKDSPRKVNASPRKNLNKSNPDSPKTKTSAREAGHASANKNQRSDSTLQTRKSRELDEKSDGVSQRLQEQASDLDSSVSSIRSLVLGTVQPIETFDDIEIKQEKDDDLEYGMSISRDSETREDVITPEKDKTLGESSKTAEEPKKSSSSSKVAQQTVSEPTKDTSSSNTKDTRPILKVPTPSKRGRPTKEESTTQAKKAKIDTVEKAPKPVDTGDQAVTAESKSAGEVQPVIIDRNKEVLQHKISLPASEVNPDQPKRQGFVITEKQMKELMAGGPEALNQFVKKHMDLARGKEASRAIVKIKVPDTAQEVPAERTSTMTTASNKNAPEKKEASESDTADTAKTVSSLKSSTSKKKDDADTDKNISDSDEQDDDQAPRRSSRKRRPSTRLKEAQESMSEDDDKTPPGQHARTRSGSAPKTADSTAKQPDQSGRPQSSQRHSLRSAGTVNLDRSMDQRGQKKPAGEANQMSKATKSPEKPSGRQAQKKSIADGKQDSLTALTLKHLMKTTGASLQLQTALGVTDGESPKTLASVKPTKKQSTSSESESAKSPERISPESHPAAPINIAPRSPSPTRHTQLKQTPPAQQRSAVDYLENMLQMTRQSTAKLTEQAPPGQINIGASSGAKSLGTVGGSVTINTGEDSPYQVYVEHSSDGSNIQISLRKVDSAPSGSPQTPAALPSPGSGGGGGDGSPGVYVGTIGASASKEKPSPSPLAAPAVSEPSTPFDGPKTRGSKPHQADKGKTPVVHSSTDGSGDAGGEAVKMLPGAQPEASATDKTQKTSAQRTSRNRAAKTKEPEKSQKKKEVERENTSVEKAHSAAVTSEDSESSAVKNVKCALNVKETGGNKSDLIDKSSAAGADSSIPKTVSTKPKSKDAALESVAQQAPSSSKTPTVIRKVIGKSLTQQQLMEYLSSGKIRVVQKTSPLQTVPISPANTGAEKIKDLSKATVDEASTSNQESVTSPKVASSKEQAVPSKPKVLVVHPQQITRKRSGQVVPQPQPEVTSHEVGQGVTPASQVPAAVSQPEVVPPQSLSPAKLPQKNLAQVQQMAPARLQTVTYTVTPQQAAPRSYAPKPQQMAQTKQVHGPPVKVIPVSPTVPLPAVVKPSVPDSSSSPSAETKTVGSNLSAKKNDTVQLNQQSGVSLSESPSLQSSASVQATKVIEIRHALRSKLSPVPLVSAHQKQAVNTALVSPSATQKSVPAQAVVKAVAVTQVQAATAKPDEKKEAPVRQTRAASAQSAMKEVPVRQTRTASAQSPVKEVSARQTRAASAQSPVKPVVLKESGGVAPKVIVYPSHMLAVPELKQAASVASSEVQPSVSTLQTVQSPVNVPVAQPSGSHIKVVPVSPKPSPAVQSPLSVSTPQPSGSQIKVVSMSPKPSPSTQQSKQTPEQPVVIARSTQPVKKILKITPHQLGEFLKLQNIPSSKSVALTQQQMNLLLQQSTSHCSISVAPSTTPTVSSGGSTQTITPTETAVSQVNGNPPVSVSAVKLVTSSMPQVAVQRVIPHTAVVSPSLVTEIHGMPILSTASEAVAEISSALQLSPTQSSPKVSASDTPTMADEAKAGGGKKKTPGYRLQCDLCMNVYFNIRAWEAHLPTCTEAASQGQDQTA